MPDKFLRFHLASILSAQGLEMQMAEKKQNDNKSTGYCISLITFTEIQVERNMAITKKNLKMIKRVRQHINKQYQLTKNSGCICFHYLSD